MCASLALVVCLGASTVLYRGASRSLRNEVREHLKAVAEDKLVHGLRLGMLIHGVFMKTLRIIPQGVFFFEGIFYTNL